jgi:hypothetical protein
MHALVDHILAYLYASYDSKSHHRFHFLPTKTIFIVNIFGKYVIIIKNQIESPNLSVGDTGAQVFQYIHLYYYLNLSISTQKYFNVDICTFTNQIHNYI